MVDKVDRPDAPPPYMVRSPTETKKDKPKEERRQEDLPTFKRREEENLYREKFGADTGVLKTVKIPLTEVKEFRFKKAIPRHGAPMVDAELILQDGKKIANAGFLLRGWQDFMKIKNLKPGEIVPAEFWNYQGSQVEITIRTTAASGPWNVREIEKEAAPPPAERKRTDYRRYAAWGAGALALAAALLWMALS